ncbi:DJ-1/PfpI family protein [Propionicicella superfundia]|uniref:DJ-1/PfpI family protein n=1 Tax=Propionicicella superfundia TaxID=348582 RepID=UPI0004902EDC|nr:DJ-1/PfpI family protein [Propionicicella superfundia]
MRRLGILLFDGVEELDAMGPWEVLSYWTSHHPADGWETRLVARDKVPVTAAKGAVLVPHAAWAPDLDLVVIPGGAGTRALMRDAGTLAWVRDLRERGALITSVCTGALVLAAAGLLAGRAATTYHASFGELLAAEPTCLPDREARWVDTGDVVTAAGVSAGIDMALHLVDRLAGRERARQVRRGIQYDPEPPV